MPNFTDKYNTDLSANEQQEFNGWVMRQRTLSGRDPLVDKMDYDIQGWWKENKGKDLAEGHLTDKFKKPSHPTFSDESIYNGVDGFKGGKWGGGEGSWTFTPGPTNMQFHQPDDIKNYFARSDPDVKLILQDAK